MNSINKKSFINTITLFKNKFNCEKIRHNVAFSSCSNETKIKIPYRIERSSTDILRALSNTIQTDPTAAHYKYHDDPYLMPKSNMSKRTYAMAQEAGRKAAYWIQQQHAELFQHKNADPPIEAFTPKMVFNENSEVDLNILKNVITNGEVNDAILIYKLLNQKQIEIPDDVKLNLLQLICFYNHENVLNEEWIEERWFQQSSTGKGRQRNTWKDGEISEQLFNELKTKDEKSYSAIIRGMAKYYQVERAWSLFQEAYDKKIHLDVNTFNSILNVVNFMKENSELRWNLTKDILGMMSDRNLKPNVQTMNAIMSTISTIGIYKLARTYTLQTLAEFKSLGIEPSLTTWYYVLRIFCRERGPVSHILMDILNEIENKEFIIQEPKDVSFFVTAMDICSNHIHDKDCAKRLDNLLHFGNNYDFVGDSYKESIYYRHYFNLLSQTEEFEVFMEDYYNKFVPNIYIPEAMVIENIINAIDVNGALHHLPKIWSDIIIFDQTNRESLLKHVLKIIIDNPLNEGNELIGKFSEIAWSIWKILSEQPETRTKKLQIYGDMLSEIIEICRRNNEFEKCLEIFNYLDENQHKIVGSPNPQYLGNLIKLSILEKQPSKAISILQFCVDNSFTESEEFGKFILNSVTLDDAQNNKIKRLIGENV